jgi:glycosyltransferase involved in cell wall biosynthesis
MKVLFLGFTIEEKTLDEIALKSKIKGSPAPAIFSNNFLKGMVSNGVNVSVYSIPPVNDYPGGCLFAWGKRKQTLDCGITVHWIPTINLQFIKQIGISISTFFIVSNWLFRCRKTCDKVVVTYSTYPPYTEVSQWLCKLFRCNSMALITDLPELMYKDIDVSGPKKLFRSYFNGQMKKLQRRFDLYVLLTKQMARRMKIEEKPYMVMEGFCNPELLGEVKKQTKNSAKTIMYAGALSLRYGIKMLVDGFSLLSGDYELWLFGTGECKEYIEKCALVDKRIKYFGRVTRERVFAAEQQAHLLTMLESKDDPLIEFSSPSKIFEYMLSGTPILSTKMPGLPYEYADYMYKLVNESAEGIKNAIEEIFSEGELAIERKGLKAKEFVSRLKNCEVQCKRIVEFMSTHIEIA